MRFSDRIEESHARMLASLPSYAELRDVQPVEAPKPVERREPIPCRRKTVELRAVRPVASEA